MNTSPVSRVKAFTVFILLLTASFLLLTSLAQGQATYALRSSGIYAPDITPTMTPSPTATPPFKVSYLDVGQGDSIYLHASDGTDILIDGGPRSAGPAVVAHLQDENVDDIEVMILSHGDADHVGGLIDVLRSTIPVEAVIYNGQHHTTLTYQEFLTETMKRGLTPTPAQSGQSYTWGPVNASVLNPQAVLDADQNENSVVLLVAYGDVRFLFTGDISSDTEQVLLDSVTGTLTLRYQLPADVLKVPHHGSAGSSSAAFLEAVGAEVAVISVGANNPYGHPTQETLERLKAAGAQVYRTDQNGTVVVTTDGQTYEVRANFIVFLPAVVKNWPPTPTPTLTPTPTNTPVPSQTPSPTATQGPVTSGNVVITTIFYDGVGSSEPDEYVEIRNDDTRSIQLQGWTLRDEANHVYTFPNHLMTPGQICRVYTNEIHTEWCGFNYGSGSAIWNNGGDTAFLRDGTGVLIDTYSY